ncbi:MAG: pyridoxal 5'-phosphate synthase glutaminase subunit PdxT [Acidimicrobiales bacterium]
MDREVGRPLRIGVLALQGDVEEHSRVLASLGASPVEVRRPADLEGLDGLVLPGGESTTLSLLMESAELFEPVLSLLEAGLPALGTCAGMILLASDLLDGRPDQKTFGVIDIAVRRNAFGSQVSSFETELSLARVGPLAGGPFHAVFIRAPGVEKVGPGVEVLASLESTDVGGAVLCRQGRALAAAFHPELSGDLRVHELFLEMVGSAPAEGAGAAPATSVGSLPAHG